MCRNTTITCNGSRKRPVNSGKTCLLFWWHCIYTAACINVLMVAPYRSSADHICQDSLMLKICLDIQFAHSSDLQREKQRSSEERLVQNVISTASLFHRNIVSLFKFHHCTSITIMIFYIKQCTVDCLRL